MKKSYLAVVISSVLWIAACDDNAMTQKVVEAEKKIVQLESNVKRMEGELKAKEDELLALQEKAKQAQASVLGLQVTIEPIFQKSETLKFDQQAKDELESNETKVSAFASLPTTGIDWIDQAFLAKIYKSYTQEGEKLPEKLTKETLVAKLQSLFDEMIAEGKEFKPFGLSFSIDSHFVGQRNNIATFTILSYSYSGGAHGMYGTDYLVMDLDKKAVIELNDLIDPKNQDAVKEMLWERYRSERLDENGNYQGFVDKEQFELSTEFYFSPNGITFVYPPYAIGSYAEGEIELPLMWHEVNELLNKDYQLTAKDGYGLHTVE